MDGGLTDDAITEPACGIRAGDRGLGAAHTEPMLVRAVHGLITLILVHQYLERL